MVVQFQERTTAKWCLPRQVGGYVRVTLVNVCGLARQRESRQEKKEVTPAAEIQAVNVVNS